MDLKSNQTYVGYSHMVCARNTLAYFADRTIYKLRLDWCWIFSFGSLQSTFLLLTLDRGGKGGVFIRFTFVHYWMFLLHYISLLSINCSSSLAVSPRRPLPQYHLPSFLFHPSVLMNSTLWLQSTHKIYSIFLSEGDLCLSTSPSSMPNLSYMPNGLYSLIIIYLMSNHKI